MHIYTYTYIQRYQRHLESKRIEKERFLASQPPPEIQPRYPR
jgi:hypothetical protein